MVGEEVCGCLGTKRMWCLRKRKKMKGNFHGDTEEFCVYGLSFRRVRSSLPGNAVPALAAIERLARRPARRHLVDAASSDRQRQAPRKEGREGWGGREGGRRGRRDWGCWAIHQAAVWSKFMEAKTCWVKALWRQTAPCTPDAPVATFTASPSLPASHQTDCSSGISHIQRWGETAKMKSSGN